MRLQVVTSPVYQLSQRRGITPITYPQVATSAAGRVEYSARAGTITRFSYEDDEGYNQLGDYAWYTDNSYDLGNSHPDCSTHAVGQKLANP